MAGIMLQLTVPFIALFTQGLIMVTTGAVTTEADTTLVPTMVADMVAVADVGKPSLGIPQLE